MKNIEVTVRSSALRALLAPLFVAIVPLLFVTANAASADPARDSSGMVPVDPTAADSETHGVDVDGTELADPGDAFASEPEWASCLIQIETGNEACFEDYGDKFNVYDGAADGASAAAVWWTDYGRSGVCYNNNSPGAGTWDSCNYDMREDGIVYWYTCNHDRSAGGEPDCTVGYGERRINGD